MAIERLLFADAIPDAEEASLVIFGVPYDGTSSYRPGARFAPHAIRQASYNFETYHPDLKVDLGDATFADAGDLPEVGRSEVLVETVEEAASSYVASGRRTLALGGEHSLTAPLVGAHEDVTVVILDAHMDFRDEYLGDPHSHACVTRRVVDQVGVERTLVVGVRSFSKEEAADVAAMGLPHVSATQIVEEGLEDVLSTLEDRPDPVYLSLDMDALDPAYAPAVGNPEPLGLTPRHVVEIIQALGSRIQGFDVTEVSPPWDQGITAALAARLAREVLAVLHAEDVI